MYPPLCDFTKQLAACGDCRRLAVDYGANLSASRRHDADPRDFGLPLTVTRIDLEEHLLTVHASWLPGRQPDCEVCDAWRADHVIGPMSESEAAHRAWHLCEPLRAVSTDGHFDLSYLSDLSYLNGTGRRPRQC